MALLHALHRAPQPRQPLAPLVSPPTATSRPSRPINLDNHRPEFLNPHLALRLGANSKRSLHEEQLDGHFKTTYDRDRYHDLH